MAAAMAGGKGRKKVSVCACVCSREKAGDRGNLNDSQQAQKLFMCVFGMCRTRLKGLVPAA